VTYIGETGGLYRMKAGVGLAQILDLKSTLRLLHN